MKLHTHPALFRQAIRFTSDRKEIPEIYIEKDYWVTYALKQIFSDPEIASYTVFKGGTALSKCYKMIERFSEDIDLVVLKRDGERNAARDRKVKSISKLMETSLPEISIDGLTRKRGQIRKTAHQYEKSFRGDFGQVRDVIIVEATWFGHSEPWQEIEIASYIYEEQRTLDQVSTLNGFEMEPFRIKVLDPKRTLCEKIMSLVRFSYQANPILDLKNKIRHTYDLYQMLQRQEILNFFTSQKFDEMMVRVGQEDAESFKNNNSWLANHPAKAPIFSKLDTVWPELSSTYEGNFANLVYGKLPTPKQIQNNLSNIEQRLGRIEWQINLDNLA
ncbi:MAG: nucleotidyl transferase AbiEii/AbiGii toxin family protein [Bacteroidota bacterium]